MMFAEILKFAFVYVRGIFLKIVFLLNSQNLWMTVQRWIEKNMKQKQVTVFLLCSNNYFWVAWKMSDPGVHKDTILDSEGCAFFATI